MNVTILIPTALRGFTDRQNEVKVSANTVGEAVRALAEAYPELKHQIYADEKTLRGFINVFLDGVNIRKLNGAETPVREGSSIMLVPAIAGGW